MKPSKLIPVLSRIINIKAAPMHRGLPLIHRVSNSQTQASAFAQPKMKPHTALNNPSLLSCVLSHPYHSSTNCTLHHTEKSLHSDCGLPPFSRLKGIDFVTATVKGVKDYKATLELVLNAGKPPSWESICQPLEKAEGKLEYLQGCLQHFNAVMNSPDFMRAEKICTPLFSSHVIWCLNNIKLYKAYKAVEQSPTFKSLSSAKQKVVNAKLREFKDEQPCLSIKQEVRLQKITGLLGELSGCFSDNVFRSTSEWSQLVTNKDQLLGLPLFALEIAKEKAEQKGLSGYLLTLDGPCFTAVMTTCKDPKIRESIYTAYVTRASEIGPHAHKWDNGPVMAEILSLRQEEASLLGFDNFSDSTITHRMASSSEAVFKFLQELVEKLRDKAGEERSELNKYALEKHGLSRIQPWDQAFIATTLKEEKHHISAEALRDYFPEKNVLEGLFTIINRLYGVTITQAEDLNTWHPDVTLYEVRDENARLCGRFSLDLYTRDGKQSGAWVMEAQPRRVSSSGEIQHPEAYVVCNFAKPPAGASPCLMHDEVTTLFHEMGHCLHQILTTVDASGVSGTSGVPLDGVELPSQLMENWCWNKDALKLISSHQDTGAPLSDEIIDNLLAAKNFHGAKLLLRQLEFALIDMVFHSGFDLKETGIKDMVSAVNEFIALDPLPDFSRAVSAFSHIFSGSYSAGYYSYLWSEVMSAAAFARFEKEGVFNAKTGADFREHILSKGGSEDMMPLLVRFLGQEASIDPFLRQRGLKK